jgi:ribosomal protein S18 acetylase RimI-like enzyme
VSAPGALVRPAEPRDLETLIGFAAAMARETEDKAHDPPTLRAGVAALLADPARGRTFVVESGGAVVAALMLTFEWSDWRNGWWWWIQSVYVAPEARRRGHYRALHEHVRAAAAQQPDVCGLRLYVETDNRNAQATYRVMGMHEAPYRIYEQATR